MEKTCQVIEETPSVIKKILISTILFCVVVYEKIMWNLPWYREIAELKERVAIRERGIQSLKKDILRLKDEGSFFEKLEENLRKSDPYMRRR